MKDNGIVKIHKGIPIPPGKIGATKYPFNELEIGDSFVVPESHAAAQMAGFGNRQYKPKRFTSRKIGPTERRIWRVA